MLCALIMAGGKGERFWPLSTDEKPKQFLKLLTEDTMIQMTVNRLLPLIPMERIFIVTGKRYAELVKEQLPNLPERNIIVEPVGKNTAPCIALSAFIINKYYKDAAIAVLPSDHLIKDEIKFIDILKEAYKFVENTEETIVTLGMKPDRPETGYGYIQLRVEGGEWRVDSEQSIVSEKLRVESGKLTISEDVSEPVHNEQFVNDTVELRVSGSYGSWEMVNGEWKMKSSQSKVCKKMIVDNELLKTQGLQSGKNDFQICKVERFVEKPDLKKAKEYLKQGNFLWNGGMFVWKCSTVLKLTERYLNNTYNVLKNISECPDEIFHDILDKKYHEIESISVDYGIMEKAENIYVIPSDFGWDDVGTWHSVERYRKKDHNNNVYVGNIKNIEGCNNIVVAREKPIVVAGLKDVFVVESDDIIFVGKKEDIERIKDIKQKAM